MAGLPTVMLTRPDGTEIDRTLGFVDTDKFIRTMDDYMRGIGTLDAMLTAEAERAGDLTFLMDLGEKLYSHSRFDEADVRFAAIVKTDSTNADEQAAEAQLMRAKVAYKAENYPLCIAFCKALRERWPGSEKREEATIYLAYYQQKAEQNDQALATYSEYLKNWPEGEDADYAREQIAKLNGEDKEPEE